MTVKLTMPLYIEIGVKKKRKISISLNIYRNLHYQISNNVKKLYKQEVKRQLEAYPTKIKTPTRLKFIYYNPTKRRSDLENFCAIHNKFIQDALVELGYIEDDNYEFITQIEYVYGGYDKGNGRVEVFIG